MEKFQQEGSIESVRYGLAKHRFLEELEELSRKFDKQSADMRSGPIYAEYIEKIKAGKKLSRGETVIGMAVDIAHSSGLRGAEYDAFINELFLPLKRRKDDDD